MNYFFKAKNTVAFGLLTAVVAAGSIAPAFAAELPAGYGDHVNPVNTEYEQTATLAQPSEESMADFVKTLDMLTREEKDLLVAAENAKAPYYEQMNKLIGQIDTKTNEILKDAQPLFDNIFSIKEAHKELWAKVDTSENESQKAVGHDYIKFIQLSDAVTKAEKAVLIQDQKKIDALYKEVDTYYAKAARATADLNAQLDSVIANIQSINSKTASIWEKVYTK